MIKFLLKTVYAAVPQLIQNIPGYIKHCRTGIIVCALLTGSAYSIYCLEVGRFEDLRRLGDIHYFKGAQHKRVYLETQQTCRNMIKNISYDFVHVVRQESLLTPIEIQQLGNPQDKVFLFSLHQIDLYTRLAAFVYGASMLAMIMRVQLAMLFGHSSCEFLVGKNLRPQLNDTVRENFLMLMEVFLKEEALTNLVLKIRKSVMEVLSTYDVDQYPRIDKLRLLFRELEKSARGHGSSPSSRMLKFLARAKLPLQEESEYDRRLLSTLFMEMYMWLETSEAVKLHAANMHAGFRIAYEAARASMENVLGSQRNQESEDGMAEVDLLLEAEEAMENAPHDQDAPPSHDPDGAGDQNREPAELIDDDEPEIWYELMHNDVIATHLNCAMIAFKKLLNDYIDLLTVGVQPESQPLLHSHFNKISQLNSDFSYFVFKGTMAKCVEPDMLDLIDLDKLCGRS